LDRARHRRHQLQDPNARKPNGNGRAFKEPARPTSAAAIWRQGGVAYAAAWQVQLVSGYSLHQALAEIGRVRKTVFVLRFLDDPVYRRYIGQELNKGEQSHALSRFLFFGKEGAVRGRTFQDPVNTFSCLAVLHNAVVAWNTLRLGEVVAGLRANGHVIPDRELARTWPVRLRGTENRHKTTQNSHAEISFLRGPDVEYFNGLYGAKIPCEMPHFARAFTVER